MPLSSSLPEPDARSLAHSRDLRSVLMQRCEDGPISFRAYMQAILYEPGFGYYMAGAEKFGASGDFITAPEVTPLFGQTVAAQVLEVLSATGGQVLEFGAGAGGLAASVVPELGESDYLILEPSAELQRRQKERLRRELAQDQFKQIHWLTTLPEQFVGVVLANEVLDAFAVECFRIGDSGQVEQLSVTVQENQVLEIWQLATEQLTQAVRKIETDLGHTLPVGYRSEINLTLQSWLTSVSESIATGVVLLIDYGYPRAEYYSPERTSGTLQCFYQHRVHDDVYRHPGLQDVTAHIDFTATIEAADAAGLTLLGYTTQASFLMSLGLLTRAEQAQHSCQNEAQRISLMKAVKTLTMPAEMGERFQVMGLGKNFNQPLTGFAISDLSHRL
ncbi:MAG: SAM-dependent methyltransferase [Gammaproteobacteria bacterium]|nr:SAM-dependent methyltransferase [Gammaproteobacteria bacterium]